MANMNIKDKKVLITGASSGIGEAIALAFAEQGSALILAGRNMVELQRVKAACSQAQSVTTLQIDLADHDNIFTICDDLIKKEGTIDILINNAGVSQRSLAHETKFEVDKFIINVNLLGTIALTKALLPSMIKKGTGHIVVVSSLMGKFSSPLRTTYAAAKHGLHGFFDGLRAELYKKNIKVLMVCPGFIQTNVSINAVTGDGSKQNTMDNATQNGLPPSAVAKKIIKALNKNKEEINVGGKEVMFLYLKRFFPRLLSKAMLKAKVT